MWGWNLCNHFILRNTKWESKTGFVFMQNDSTKNNSLKLQARNYGLWSVYDRAYSFFELSKLPFSIVLVAQICFPYWSLSRISTFGSIMNPSFRNLSTSISITSNTFLFRNSFDVLSHSDTSGRHVSGNKNFGWKNICFAVQIMHLCTPNIITSVFDLQLY